ncbi:hypothetical protein NCS56_00892400 [Fusarium sp. Ph1]|nr:hypothetical protein NCS56_00892400 [Fusarium sp. Ph1]
MRKLFGHHTNKYTRLRVTWDKMYHPLIAREGLFYSALAQFSMENPDHVQHLETKGKIAHIAASWSPGSELTKEHVDGLLPNLGEAGVKLYSFVLDVLEWSKLEGEVVEEEETQNQAEHEDEDISSKATNAVQSTPKKSGDGRERKRRGIGKRKI